MFDANGFRFNVGIILANKEGRLFLGKRYGLRDAWQFPQGGMQENETPEEAMYRELTEELGLVASDVEILGKTQNWLYYRLPPRMRRYGSKPLCIGQKQKWFLLRLVGGEENIRFDATNTPEFDNWQWVDYWFPLQRVISFKKKVYQKALTELETYLNK